MALLGGGVWGYYKLTQDDVPAQTLAKTEVAEEHPEDELPGEEQPSEQGGGVQGEQEEPKEVEDDTTTPGEDVVPAQTENETESGTTEPSPTGEGIPAYTPEESTDTVTSDEDERDDDTSDKAEDDSEASPRKEEIVDEPKVIKKEDTVYTEELKMLGSGASSAATKRLWNEWVERMIKRGEVRVLAPILEEQIRAIAPSLANSKQLNYTTYRNAPVLMDAVDLCYMARMVNLERLDELIRPLHGRAEQAANSWAEFMRWMLLDKTRPLHRLLQEFTLNSGRAEEFSRTLSVFYSLWKDTDERDRVRYMNLAIACSLVCKEVAHESGGYRDPDEPRVDIPELFKYYLSEDVKGRLLTNIQELSVSDLLYVVDVRLPKSEFEWAKKELNEFKRANWGGTYGHIEYLMERATYNADPYMVYSFEEIEQEGGKCTDQAYFCANTAKCRGIPATIMVGDGNRGPHAWVGLLTSDDNWTITGSYGYRTGRFRNPCSGQYEHASALTGRKSKLPDNKVTQVSNCMVLSDYLVLLGCKKEALATARFVCSFVPQFSAAWKNMVDVMTLCGEEMIDDKEWRRLYLNDLNQAGKKNIEILDIAEGVLNDHILAGKRDIVKITFFKKNAKRLNELIQAGRTDLAIDSMRRSVEVYLNAGNLHELEAYFRDKLKEYAGNRYFFEQVFTLYSQSLDTYSEKLKKEGEKEQAHTNYTIKNMWENCAREADNLFMKTAFRSNDFFTIKKEVEIVRLIAECWRKAENENRAKRLEKLASEQYEESRSDSTPKTPQKRRRR